jgi:hypothetical protein
MRDLAVQASLFYLFWTMRESSAIVHRDATREAPSVIYQAYGLDLPRVALPDAFLAAAQRQRLAGKASFGCGRRQA